MKKGIILCTDDHETCCMALRYAAFHCAECTDVGMYLTGPGLRYDKDALRASELRRLMAEFKASGGKLFRSRDRRLLHKRLLKDFDGILSSRQIDSICHNDKFQSIMMRDAFVRKFI